MDGEESKCWGLIFSKKKKKKTRNESKRVENRKGYGRLTWSGARLEKFGRDNKSLVWSRGVYLDS